MHADISCSNVQYYSVCMFSLLTEKPYIAKNHYGLMLYFAFFKHVLILDSHI